MIVRAWGTVNGYDVVLRNTGGEQWAFDVPALPDGDYIVMDLAAEDDTGDVGYLATVMFIMDGRHEMQARVVPRGFRADVQNRNYTAYPTIQEVIGKIMKDKEYTGEVKIRNPYAATVRERGYRIERVVCRRSAD